MADRPLAYFITFTTYGTWLHGDPRGSVDREHNDVGAPFLEPEPLRSNAARQRMAQEYYVLDEPRRMIVRDAIVEECEFRGWLLLAVHVRSNHVHIVVTAECEPEFAMRSCKAQASKRLNRAGFDDGNRKRWTTHGSTRYLWTKEAVVEKIQYVVDGQGEQMAVFEGNWRGAVGLG
jgi:REP element-mobilizing transposase RayT